jgi:ATP/maltotriose-dependent transcriptional regulator MalT
VTADLGLPEVDYTAVTHLALDAASLVSGSSTEAATYLERAGLLGRRDHPTIIRVVVVDVAAVQRRRREPAAAAAARGEVEPQALAAFPRELGSATGCPGQRLSPAELRVLRLFPSDLTYREIAAQVHVSLSTIRTHARHIREKLDAATRTQAIAQARRYGYL